MKKLFVSLAACAALSGCQSSHYSSRVTAELQEAKAKCGQLHRGMSRQKVEAILKPTPNSGLDFEWNISGILSVAYQLYPGIQVEVEYGSSTSTLLMVPDELSVNLDSKDKQTRHFRQIAMGQVP